MNLVRPLGFTSRRTPTVAVPAPESHEPPSDFPRPVLVTASSTPPPAVGWSNAIRTCGVSVVACLMAASIGMNSVQGAPLSDVDPVACPAEIERQFRVLAAAQNPLAASALVLAKEALAAKLRPSPEHPYLIHKAEIGKRLHLLGLLKDSRDHVHISDVDLQHGGAVLRSALGLNPLVKSVTSTMSVADVPLEFAQRHLTDAEFKRYAGAAAGDADDEIRVPTMPKLIASAIDELEGVIQEKRLRVAQIGEQRTALTDARRIFVNMSFGQSPDRVADGIAEAIVMAPAGSILAKEAEAALGKKLVRTPADEMPYEPESPPACDSVPPEVDPPPPDDAPEDGPQDPLYAELEAQHLELKKKFVFPELRQAMSTPDSQARLQAARDGLSKELLRARTVGVLVFEAAGNEYDSARRAGDTKMSASGSTGTRGMLRVGALDLGRFSDPKDDRMAVFSAAGKISFATHGVRLPVWIEMGRLDDSEGTSFSSPVSVEVAVALASNALGISVDEVAKLLHDPRAGHDIPNTTRDGSGALDEFAAIVLAANPKLTRPAIDEAWRALGQPNPNVDAIKANLGLS